MSDLGLTPEERAYIERLSGATRQTHIAFYAAVLMPLLAFGAYGIAKRDYVAEIIAFCGLLILVLLRIAQEVSRIPLCRSTFLKIVEHERRASNV